MSLNLSSTHHVVPQSLGQLLMSLYGEVEAVVSEEGHINLSILLSERHTKKHRQIYFHAIPLRLAFKKPKSHICHTRDHNDSLCCVMFHTESSPASRHVCHVDTVVACCEADYREAGRIGVFQKGLQNHGEVISEETLAVQQLLKSFLRINRKKKYRSFICFILGAFSEIIKDNKNI